jgi:glucans biosynthesis protein
LRRNPESGGARLELHFRRNDDAKPVELRASLRAGDSVSETWSYALPPG